MKDLLLALAVAWYFIGAACLVLTLAFRVRSEKVTVTQHVIRMLLIIPLWPAFLWVVLRASGEPVCAMCEGTGNLNADHDTLNEHDGPICPACSGEGVLSRP